MVVLRAPRPSDLAGAIERATEEPGSFGPDDVTRWITYGIADAWADRSRLVFVVEYEGRYAGSVGLAPDERGSASIHFGLSRWARGAGVASRAVRLALDFAFGTCGFHLVHWWTPVGNWPSRRLAWATGFHLGPTLPSADGADEWTGWITPDDERRPRHPWFEIPVLESARIRLRSWQDDEIERITTARTNAATAHFLPFVPQPFTPEHARFWLHDMAEQAAAGQRINWCVADRGTDLALGNLTLFGLDKLAGRFGELGYWAHPEAQGRGLMAEAVRRAADWFFGRPDDGGHGGHKLVIRTAATNTAARRVAERGGFVHVGTEREAFALGSHVADDQVIYDLLGTDARS
ncbi:GNAT family N-acetyltransferase [Kribbella sp. ALI-6-A]|nr:GNAT family N-acetyltransferase [Kribbella sp. ALI-6-A]